MTCNGNQLNGSDIDHISEAGDLIDVLLFIESRHTQSVNSLFHVT